MTFVLQMCLIFVRSLLSFNYFLSKVEILKEKNYFSEKEKRTIDFVHQVEKFYSEQLQENMQIQSFPR